MYNRLWWYRKTRNTFSLYPIRMHLVFKKFRSPSPPHLFQLYINKLFERYLTNGYGSIPVYRTTMFIFVIWQYIWETCIMCGFSVQWLHFTIYSPSCLLSIIHHSIEASVTQPHRLQTDKPLDIRGNVGLGLSVWCRTGTCGWALIHAMTFAFCLSAHSRQTMVSLYIVFS